MGRVAPAAWRLHQPVMSPMMVEADQRDYQVVMVVAGAGQPAQVAEDVPRLLPRGQAL